MKVKLNPLAYSVEEAINRLKVNIKFVGAETKKILIISSIPGEGKSTVSVNLWKALADAGFPTVLVDADLRRSEFKERHWKSFHKNCKGLNHYLSGLASYEKIIYETDVKNGYVVPVADLLVNPSNLLESKKLDDLLDRLASEYRYVIIDSPPLESVSDGVTLASKSDGALLITQAGVTPRILVHQSLQQIERAECPLLGIVLNRMKSKLSAYRGYYYKKYYSKYYRKEE